MLDNQCDGEYEMVVSALFFFTSFFGQIETVNLWDRHGNVGKYLTATAAPQRLESSIGVS